MTSQINSIRRPLLLGLLLAAVVALAWRMRSDPANRTALSTPGKESTGVSSSEGHLARRRAGRFAESPDPSWIQAGREVMGNAREDQCGGYLLVSDVPAASLKAVCRALAAEIEAVYVERFEVQPVGEPAGAILAFAERSDFRAFVRSQTGLPAGYAAFTRPSRGIIAIPLGYDLRRLPQTLAHEMAHMVHRRAFGSDLPPWLSEGLADAIGDSATEDGFSPLARAAGAEALSRRLTGAIDAGTARPLSDLLATGRPSFDRETGHVDYAQSALLTRFLLTDEELGDRFRSYLGALANGEPYSGGELLTTLGLTSASLELRFHQWLGRPRR